MPGKVAWLAEGLPGEGRRRDDQRVGAIADADVPVVRAGSTVGDAAGHLGADDDLAVVLDDDDIVLGLLRRPALGLDPATPVEDVAQPGPSTFRPSLTIRELHDYFERGHDERALVTTLTGRWIGLIRRTDLLDG